MFIMHFKQKYIINIFCQLLLSSTVTKAGILPYILRGQIEYTILSFYCIIKCPTDMQAKRGASMAIQKIDPK
jgi:hypothetical protein